MTTDYSKLVSEARELSEKATPGPWTDQSYEKDRYYSKEELADAQFTAASRGLVPQLCDAVERLTKALELALYYINGDATYEICKDEVEKILKGKT